MEIRQFFYNSDNLAYLLYHGKTAMAVDGGAVDSILDYLDRNDLTLTVVTHTHGHSDHTTGTHALTAATGAAYLDHCLFSDSQEIDLDGETVTVRLTPGHSMDSVIFSASGFLVTGDTLFNGTIGNCFSGDLKAFYHSIGLLMTYPPETRIYAGHDYVMASLAFARHLTPNNPAIAAYAARYDKSHVVSTLADEMTVNPYLRFNDPEMIALLRARGLPAETEYQRWESVMELD